MSQLLESIKFFIIDYGPVTIFLIGFLEELVFFLPSSPIFIAAGFFLVDPKSSVAVVLPQIFFDFGVLGATGVTLGSYFVYYLFYFGGKPFVTRFGRYFSISWEGVEKFDVKLKNTRLDEWFIFLFRAIPIFPITFISAFAGLFRIPPKEFGIFTFLGTMVRLTTLGLIGWSLGEAYVSFGDKLVTIEKYGLIVVTLFALAGLYYLIKKRHSFTS